MKYALLLLLLAACTATLDEPAPIDEQAPIDEPAQLDANLLCDSDADCTVGGCSGQVCGNTAFASNVITTCEYKEIYSCYKQTSCSCIKSQCQWEETPAYLNCLEALS